jgi:phosphoesterase RecJ-like protein
MTNEFDNIIKIINEKNNFLLTTHQNPDGDAIGSISALGLFLKQLGKNVDYFVQTPISREANLLNEISNFNNRIIEGYDAVFTVDCSSRSYVYAPEYYYDIKPRIVIDHHATNEYYGDINYVGECSAAAELVYLLGQKLDIVFTPEMAEAIFLGITSDTGSFKYTNVTSQTHKIVSELYEVVGSSEPFAYISYKVHKETSYQLLKVLSLALDTLELFCDNKVSMMVVTKDIIDNNGGVVGDDVVNYGINIENVEVAFLVKEYNNQKYKISIRSRGKIDVKDIAYEFSGGGHAAAAGFTYKGDIEELKKSLIEKVALML